MPFRPPASKTLLQPIVPEFSSPDLEARYRETAWTGLAAQLRILSIAALALAPIFLVADYAALGFGFDFAVIAAFWTAAVALAAATVRATLRRRRRAMRVASVGGAFAFSALAFASSVLRPEDAMGNLGATALLALVFYHLIPMEWTKRVAAAASLSVLVGAATAIHAEDANTAFLILAMVGLGNLIGALTSRNVERLRRVQYAGRHAERDAHERLKAEIAERERAVAQREIVAARFRDLIEGSIQGIVIHRNFRVLFANGAYARMWGYADAADMTARMGGMLEHIPEEWRPQAQRDYAALIASQSAMAPKRVRNIRRDGSVVWVDLVERVVNWEGEPAIQSTIMDVTAQVEAVRTQALLFEAIGGISDGIALFDDGDRLVHFNEPYRRAHPALPPLEKAVGRSWAELARLAVGDPDGPPPNVDVDAWLAARIAERRGAAARTREIALGGDAWRLVRETRLPGGGTVCIETDVTALKRREELLGEREGALTLANERLAEQAKRLSSLAAELETALRRAESANDAKSRFLATMSHELRTPLNAVIGFADVMRGELFGPLGHVKYAEYAEDIHRSGSHLLSLVNDILDVAKIDAGKMQLSLERVDLRAALRACANIVAGRAAEAGLTVKQNLPKDLPTIMADERAIRQIALNLLSNAVKFSPSGGVVRLAARAVPEADAVEIEISDDGIGISEDMQVRLFEPFEREDNRYSRSAGGTGLGLSIVKGLVDLHGGRIHVDSAPGQGATIVVRLPRAAADRPAPPRPTLAST